MDPYVILTRLRDAAKRFEDAYWRFDDRAQLIISAAADRYEEREPITKWYDVLWYGLFWLAEAYEWIHDAVARSRPVRAWQKRQQAKFDLERAEFRKKIAREMAAEDAREDAREAYRAREARRLAPSPIPEPHPLAVQTPAEIAAAELEREKRLRDRAEQDWNARNIRLSDVKYWDDPSDPRRWHNPPFPG